MLATPPRVVRVQEDTMDEEFEEKFAQKLNLNLNPDLTYFAPNWRRKIPGLIKQRTLESFGVTSSRGGPHQPWEPSASTPEIPLNWLQDQPKVAWQIMRENSLYSDAPIPPLLHSWSEARMVLMRWGYTLAFETRTTGPRTWFHFDRDVLFVDRGARGRFQNEEDLLTACPWMILGQFHSKDLKRVRRVALGTSGAFLFPWKHYDSYPSLALTIRLFPDLRELQIVQWWEEDLFLWRNFGKGGSVRHPWYSDPGIHALAGELYSLPVEEIDALLPLLSYLDGIRSDMPASGVLGEMVKSHKQRFDANGPGFFEYQQQRLEQRLAEQRDKLQRFSQETEPDLSVFSWKIPRVKAVHILPPSMAVLLQQERQVAWEKFLKMKQNWQAAAAGCTQMDLSQGRAALLSSVTNLESEDDHICDPYSEINLYGNASDITYRNARQWWATEGMIPAPSSGALF
ncbi:hypothetical protein BDW62DRAFT_194701 [Aspergillus aurantiobrunneus]